MVVLVVVARLVKALRQLVKIRMKKWKGQQKSEGGCNEHKMRPPTSQLPSFLPPQIKITIFFKIFHAGGRDLPSTSILAYIAAHFR